MHLLELLRNSGFQSSSSLHQGGYGGCLCCGRLLCVCTVVDCVFQLFLKNLIARQLGSNIFFLVRTNRKKKRGKLLGWHSYLVSSLNLFDFDFGFKSDCSWNWRAGSPNHTLRWTRVGVGLGPVTVELWSYFISDVIPICTNHRKSKKKEKKEAALMMSQLLDFYICHYEVIIFLLPH